MGRRHLFLAMIGAAFGEATLARRLAWQLHARGDEVVVLGSSELRPLWIGTPFTFGATDAIARVIDEAIPAVIAKQRIDDVVLVDLTSTIIACRLFGIDPAFVHRLAVPVVALDAWNLPETTRRWDLVGDSLDITGVDVPRLVAVPFARPEAPGAYCALPDEAPAPSTTHARRQILITTAAWQAQAPRGATSSTLYEAVPDLLIAELATLDADVVHVGPAPFARPEPLGAGYMWRGRITPDEMRTCLGASDLLVTLNLAATTISSALASGVPAVVGVNSNADRLPPFAVWPLGLKAFLAPVLANNPFSEVVRSVELTEQGAIASTCSALLFDAGARESMLTAIASYVRRVRELPTGAEMLSSLL